MWMGWLTAIIIAAAVGPAIADCTRSQLPTMCAWEEQIAVEEWRVQQRAEAEVRARMGPPPAEEEEVVRHWRAFDLSKFPEER
jgi:hypothetical protein